VSRPRLLILTPDYPPAKGGIQLLLGRLAEGLAERWEVTVVAPAHPEAAGHDAGAPFRTVRLRTPWSRRTPGVLAEMVLRGRAARPQLVLAGHALTLPAAMAVAGRRPVACFLHGSELWAPLTQRALRALGPRVRLGLAVSRFTAGEAARLGIPADRIHVTPLGADPPASPPDAASRLRALGLLDERGRTLPYFLTVARLAEPHKGQDVFIDALAPLLARDPRIRYVIAGDGPLRSHFARLACARGVGAAVVMPGRIDELTKGALLRACRALVMLCKEAPAAAQFEGLGIAFVEAAMAGRASLAGRSGGVPEVVRDRRTGLLVDPADVPAVVEAARRLLEEDGLADGLGAAAEQWARRERTWPALVVRVDSLLAQLVRS
jgi:phosphatidylinositol alpha-1,6-mannosyltransferase